MNSIILTLFRVFLSSSIHRSDPYAGILPVKMIRIKANQKDFLCTHGRGFRRTDEQLEKLERTLAHASPSIIPWEEVRTPISSHHRCSCNHIGLLSPLEITIQVDLQAPPTWFSNRILMVDQYCRPAISIGRNGVSDTQRLITARNSSAHEFYYRSFSLYSSTSQNPSLSLVETFILILYAVSLGFQSLEWNYIGVYHPDPNDECRVCSNNTEARTSTPVKRIMSLQIISFCFATISSEYF